VVELSDARHDAGFNFDTIARETVDQTCSLLQIHREESSALAQPAHHQYTAVDPCDGSRRDLEPAYGRQMNDDVFIPGLCRVLADSNELLAQFHSAPRSSRPIARSRPLCMVNLVAVELRPDLQGQRVLRPPEVLVHFVSS
jgi:hypothetical protein